MPTLETHSIDLGSVQKTLLLPLWGRAVEAKKDRPLLMDPTAAKIMESVDYDFASMASKMSFVTQLAWIARCLHIDRTVREFLVRHPEATVVNLGCGLDTTFERVDNGKVCWYDLDLPDVIELRSHYIPESQRRKFVACSMLDDRWFASITSTANPVLLVIAGVLYYFTETEVKNLFTRIAERFASSELIFDASSPRGISIANKRVIQDGGMDSAANLKWGLVRAADLEKWDKRIRVVEAYPMFRGIRGKLSSLKEKWGTLMSDVLGIMSMVHLRIENGSAG
jgi:O-methyltransferase involved in polyketide biosynthesis